MLCSRSYWKNDRIVKRNIFLKQARNNPRLFIKLIIILFHNKNEGGKLWVGWVQLS